MNTAKVTAMPKKKRKAHRVARPPGRELHDTRLRVEQYTYKAIQLAIEKVTNARAQQGYRRKPSMQGLVNSMIEFCLNDQAYLRDQGVPEKDCETIRDFFNGLREDHEKELEIWRKC